MANVKVSIIGKLDMLKFKNMSKVREKAIQAAPAKDVTLRLPINDNAKALHPDFIPVVVDDIVDRGPAAAKTYYLKKEDGSPLPWFRAGQYISLKMNLDGSEISRPYSLSSGPKMALQGLYEVTVRANPNGWAADKMLAGLKKGDKLTITAPLGDFYYEPMRDAKQVVALAGGSGITPFLSMAFAIADGVEDFDLTILFGSRSVENILFKEELDALCAKCGKIKVVHVLSDEEAEGYEHGFITEELIRKYAPEGEYSLYMSGPEAMYRFVGKEVEKLGLPRRLVRREMLSVTKKVWEQPGYPQEARDKTFTLTVRQGEKEYSIPASANEPVLVALERAGVRAPSRCRSGECGWCRSRLVSGECYVPEETDGRRWADRNGGQIHPCASFPVSDLVLEVPGEYC